MIRFVPSSAAEPLSQALWGLSRPPQVRGENDTQYLFGWIPALDGKRWLMVDTDYEINVHPEALLDGLLPTTILLILAKYIDAGQLPSTADDDLTDLVAAHLGQRMNVWIAFPQFFKDMSKDHRGMIDAGLLAEPQTTP
jgi:hypothetical protein